MKRKNKRKIYDKESAIENLNNNIITGGDFNEKTLIKIFATRYSYDVLCLSYLDCFEFYQAVKKDVVQLFNHYNNPQKELLAIGLIKKIKQDYCQQSLTNTMQWFFAAVIHICFSYIKENDECFRIAFKTFDITGGNSEAFCRLIVVAQIDNYCRFANNNTTEWYTKVIEHDGEAVKDSKLPISDMKTMLYELWHDWYPKGNREDLTNSLYAFLRIHNYSKNKNEKSLYWQIRDLMKRKINK